MWRWPPGARYASVRSPLRIVRPQMSQETSSCMGRSSFFMGMLDSSDRPPRPAPFAGAFSGVRRFRLLRGLRDHLLREMRRHFLVARELHGVVALAASYRAQVGRV